MLMRLKFRTKALFILILICSFTTVGFLTAYRVFKIPSKAAEQWVVPNVNTPSRKFVAKETLVSQIQQKQELIPLEIELTEKVTIDFSWGNTGAFKMLQSIYFTGKGIYAIDLSKLYVQNIVIDNAKNTISLILPKPFVKIVSIDEQKTIYETPQKGLLRFGEIKMTPAEFQIMMSTAKIKMTEKLNSQELFGQALDNAEVSVTKLVKSIITNEIDDNYNITVQFEK
jgi:hypothetical protein